MTHFLSPALESSRLRWVVAVSLVLLGWLILGGFVSLILLQQLQLTPLRGDPLLFYLAIHAGFLCFALALPLAQKVVLRQSLHNFWFQGRFSGRRFFQALGLWMGLLALVSACEAWLFPDSIRTRGLSVLQLRYALCVLLLTPVQVAAEEIFFRGLLLRAIYRFWQEPAVALLFSALCFTAVHLHNPELNTSQAWCVLAYYFLFGLLAGQLVLVDQGLERALGWHLGNNYFAFLILSYEPSAFSTPALFHALRFDPAWNLLQFLLLVVIAFGISIKTFKRQV